MATFIGRPTEAEIAEANRIEEIEKQLDSGKMTMDELKAIALADMDQAQQQAESQAKIDIFRQGELDRRFKNEAESTRLKFAHGVESDAARKIREEFERQSEIAELEQTPEAQAEQAERDQKKTVRNLSQEIDDLQYVKNQESDALQERIRLEIARQKEQEQNASQAQNADVEKSLELQRMWVSRHPNFVPSMANGEKIKAWVIASGAKEFTYANLDAAFAALYDQLELRSPEQVQQIQDTQEQARPARRSSTVSASSSHNLYDRKLEKTAEDLENMSTAELREFGLKHGFIDPDAEMREGVRNAHTSFLPQF